MASGQGDQGTLPEQTGVSAGPVTYIELYFLLPALVLGYETEPTGHAVT